MNYFQDVRIIDVDGISPYHIWKGVFNEIHKVIGRYKRNAGGDIGVAFPEYKYSNKGLKHLGRVIRLFSKDKKQLMDADLKNKLATYKDYAETGLVLNVPDKTEGFYRFYTPTKSRSIEQKARRYAKRHNITVDESVLRFQEKGFENKIYDFPYILCRSSSNNEKFLMFVVMEKVDVLHDKGFNSYGLSKMSSLPCFNHYFCG